MSEADKTAGKQLVPFEFKKGQSGNPKGRPKGSRNKITEEFLRDFLEAWQVLGKPALLATAWKDPAAFVKVAASLCPKEIEHSGDLTVHHEDALEQLDRPAETNTAEAPGQPTPLRGELPEDQDQSWRH